MSDDSDDSFAVDSNEAMEIKLIREVDDIYSPETTFKPWMSHQVFGDKEVVIGFKGLRVKLYYTAGSLATYFGLEYEEADSEVEPDNVEKLIAPKLQRGYFVNLDKFIRTLEDEIKFKPKGILKSSFTIAEDTPNARHFEIYVSDMSDPEFVKYHERLQTFLLWYIDAANFIDADDEKWKAFVVYEKYKNSNGALCYGVTGYVTIYEYYVFPEHLRPRISQVLILPPFQKMGLCAQFLKTIYNHYKAVKNVKDIAVEDPSENFQRVRDFVDCSLCSKLPEFSKAELLKPLYSPKVKAAKDEFLLNKKQAIRVVDILRYKEVVTLGEAQLKEYEETVKKRLRGPFLKEKEMYLRWCKRFPFDKDVIKPDEFEPKVDESYKEMISQYKKVILRMNSMSFD